METGNLAKHMVSILANILELDSGRCTVREGLGRGDF